MKVDTNIVLIIYLFILPIVIIKYFLIIDKIFGGLDCLICTKVHFNGYITNWSISHFIAFLIAGYISPKSLYYIILLGISWELVELFLEYNSKLNHDHFICKQHIIECKTKLTSREFWSHYLGINESTNLWWCSGGLFGSLMDITLNTLGVFTGVYIHKSIHKKVLQYWNF
jgi:hypothetical protein